MTSILCIPSFIPVLACNNSAPDGPHCVCVCLACLALSACLPRHCVLACCGRINHGRCHPSSVCIVPGFIGGRRKFFPDEIRHFYHSYGHVRIPCFYQLVNHGLTRYFCPRNWSSLPLAWAGRPQPPTPRRRRYLRPPPPTSTEIFPWQGRRIIFIPQARPIDCHHQRPPPPPTTSLPLDCSSSNPSRSLQTTINPTLSPSCPSP